MGLPVGSAPKVREQRSDGEKVVGSEEELERWYVKACGREVEVRVQVQCSTPEQDCANVNDQEERKIAARDGLQPGDETVPLLPALNEERDATHDLKCDAAQ